MEAFDDRLLRRRLGESGMDVRVELVVRPDEEDPSLAAGVGRLQHSRHPDRVEGGPRTQHVAGAGKARLRHAGVGERAPHRDLVRHQVGGLGPNPGRAKRLRDGGDDGHSPVRRDGQHAVDAVAASDVGDCGDIGEVDRLALSAAPSPGASGFRSTAMTRRPSSFARRMARRWWRPAPTKRTVFTSRAMLSGWLGPGGKDPRRHGYALLLVAKPEGGTRAVSRARSDSRWSPRTSPRRNAPRASR